MGRTIIINEQQLSDFTRIDEVVGSTFDKIKDAIDRGKMAYQQDKERNNRIRELRYFADELYLIYGDKNGTLDEKLYKAVRKAVSKRIMQIQDVVKNHGLDFEGNGGGDSRGNDSQTFYSTKESLEAWKKYFGRDYTPEYMGQELYDAFQRCLQMEVGRRSELFYVVNKIIKPKMFELSKAKNFAFNG